VHTLESEDTLVVGDGSMGFEDRAFGFVAGEALNGLANSPHRNLSRQAEPGANLSVCQFVDRGLGEDLRVKPALCRKGRSFIGAFHCRQQSLGLFNIRQKLQLESQLHYLGVYHSATEYRMATT